MNWTINQTVDLSRGYTPVVWPDALMVSGDVGAHTWRVTVLDNGVPADLSGANITGSFLRDDGATVQVAGSVLGNVASVTLTDACYAVEGKLVGTMRAVISGATVTLAAVVYTVKLLTSGDVVDPGVTYQDFTIDASPAGTYADLAALNAANPDHSKIYITLDDGNWCYHNGMAWVAGGVYQTLMGVDNTLSVSGMAADAKTVGDIKVDKAVIEHGFTANRNSVPLWEQGTINEYGNDAGSSTRIRTKIFAEYPDVDKVVCQEGYEVYAVKRNSLGDVLDISSNPGFVDEVTLEPGLNYRFAVRRVSDEAIVPADALSALWLFDGAPDKSLTVEGFPPDAKAVGDAFGIVSDTKMDADAFRNGFKRNINKPFFWEQGHFTSTGTPGDPVAQSYPVTIRTKDYLPEGVLCVTANDPYRVKVYRYTQAGAFVDAPDRGVRFDLEAGYKYKVEVTYYSEDLVLIDPGHYHQAGLLTDPLSGSLMDKNRLVNFGLMPTSYYKGRHTAYDAGFDKMSLTGSVYAAFDALAAAHPHALKRYDRGVCSDGSKRIYEYRLVQPDSTSWVKPAHPKVLMIAAQHGFEKSIVYGLYYLIKDILENWGTDPVLEYLRYHTDIRILPVTNPWGFDAREYANANGVNLNRNFDTEGWSTGEPGPEYGGLAPFDQPEAAIIRDFVLDNLDAVLMLDLHTQGSDAVPTVDKINWISISSLDDTYYHRLFNAGEQHIRRMTRHFDADYALGLTTELCGYTTGSARYIPATAGYAPTWAIEQGVPALTFEGFNGFPGRTPHTPEVHKANSELIGNFIAMALGQLRGTL